MSVTAPYRAGVDWGSTSLRAYRLDASGRVDARREADLGIRRIEPPTAERFEAVLFEFLEGWLGEGDSVLLSGMIGSRNGWVETPYLPCPADLADITGAAQTLVRRGVNLVFLPGVSQADPPDVMRGEELQLVGCSRQDDGEALVVLPGTHSKWARLVGTRLATFRTFATGELFEVLLRHTLVGGLADGSSWHPLAFDEGVDTATADEDFLARLFTARAGVLLGQRAAGEVHAWLSGLLVGRELREGLASVAHRTPPATLDVSLVGNPLLCDRYARAFERLGVATQRPADDAAARGFERLATHALSIRLSN